MNDLKLIKGCLQHDRACQKILYDRYSRQMYSICLRYHSDSYMANEAMQRGFIAVFEKLKSFKGKGELGAWIRMIIVRKCIDLIKERKQLKYEDLENIDQHLIESAELNHSYNEINYSELVLLLDHMPLGYKTVFSMYILDGIQHKEIAEALDISVATSRSQLYKARKMMMELVQSQFKNSGMQQYQS